MIDKDMPVLNELFEGQILDANDQCKMVFGDEAVFSQVFNLNQLYLRDIKLSSFLINYQIFFLYLIKVDRKYVLSLVLRSINKRTHLLCYSQYWDRSC